MARSCAPHPRDPRPGVPRCAGVCRAAPGAGYRESVTLPSPGPAVPATPPGSDLGADIGAAARFAGRSLLRSPLALLGAGALYSVLMIVVIVVGFVAALFLVIAMIETGPSTGGELTAGQLVVTILASVGVVLVALPVGVLWQAGTARAALVLLEGGRPSVAEALIGRGRVLLTALIVLALTVLGSILFYLPGLVAAVLLMYAIPASARGASPLAAMKESASLARSHLGTSVVGTLVVMAASYVSGLVVIGFLAAMPFSLLVQMGLYERLCGRELPELAA